MAVFDAAAVLQSLPPATRGLSLTLLSFSLVLFLLRLTSWAGPEAEMHVVSWSHKDSAVAFPAIVMVPGVSWMYPWTLVTAAFCETTVTEFLISIITLPLAGRYLERLWGSIELVKFSLIIVVLSNIIAWGLSVLTYIVFRAERGMFGTQYHGLQALQVGFLVALAQLIPEHQVQLFKGRVKIRVRDLPMAYVTLSNVMCLLGEMSPFILIQFGWLISWAYLRFFKLNENGMRGDRSETFSFVAWFPPFMQIPVGALSNFLYPIFVRLQLVQPWSYSAVGDVELGVGRELPGAGAGNTRAEAERRRAMALKALDSRAPAGVTRSNSNAGSTSAAAGASAAQQQSTPKAEERPLPSATVPSVVVSSHKEKEEAQNDDGDIGSASRGNAAADERDWE